MKFKQKYDQMKLMFSDDSPPVASKRQDSTTSSTVPSQASTKSETHGQIPTNKNCIYEDGQWWYVGQSDGGRRRVESHNRKNTSRMFVDGKYIPKSHPLYKAGRYKAFSDAAFSSLENYDKNMEGQVYIAVNPAWPEWVKVGMAVDAEDRLNSYQTSCPFRDYVLYYSYNAEDRRKAESKAHYKLAQQFERRNEWFNCSPEEAIEVLNENN